MNQFVLTHPIMKRHLIYLAGLTLAATISTLPIIAQGPPRGQGPDFAGALGNPPPPRVARTEISVNDDDEGALALARAAGDASTVVRNIFTGGEFPDRPLIVTSSSSPDEKSIASLDEDLNIMARILNKSVDRDGDDDRKRAMGIHLWATGQPGARGARNLYVEGYGAIFILNVPMPLQPPPARPQVDEKKESTSSSWEEARNELYGREEHGGDYKVRSDKRPAPPYDAERVEALKKDLCESLKNATHIRGLKDNEHVTIVVQGPGSERRVQRSRNVGVRKTEVTEDVFAFALPVPGGGPRSVMTLRAKKSDIDAFAKGKTELDDFRKKVSIAVYQTPSGAATGAGEAKRF